MLRAGELIHRITIQKPDPASPKDSAGQRITAWLDVETDIAALVAPISGRIAFIAAQRQASTTHTVKIRYTAARAAIDAGHRLLFRSRVLVPDRPPVNEEEKNETLVLECTEGLRSEN